MTQPEHIQQLNNDLESIYETLENFDHSEIPEYINKDVLDVKIETRMDREIRNIQLVVATGGPHIEIDLGKNTINGYWGSDQRTRNIKPRSEAEETLNLLWDYIEESWRSGA